MEVKPDGFRAILFARPGLVTVQSRQGGDLTGAFPDIATEGQLLVLDGERERPRWSPAPARGSSI